MPIALFALTISAFAIGTTEFVIVGLVPTIAHDLGVSLPSAGLLVSLYALGVAVGAPVLTAVTARWQRKQVLLAVMSLFVLGNVLAFLAPSYSSLITARILTGLAHGVFFSIGSTIATGLVTKDKEASAIAIMFTGLTVALVTGVPLGTWIGQYFGWRATFMVVAGLGLLALIGSAILVPSNLKQTPPANITQQLSVLTQPRLLLVYAMTAIGYGGTFTAFTFLAPILEEVSGFEASSIALIMLVYGVSVALGNIWGGKLADRMGPIRALTIIFSALAIILILFTFTAMHPVTSVLTILIWGAFAFGNVPGLQVYVVQLAEKYTPYSVDVASGLNIAAFNVGIAFGSVLGGYIIQDLSLMDTSWIGGLIVLVALLLTRLSGVLDQRTGLKSA
ncbi:MFS transporter [Bermanella marisrubri]|uniref:Major facilitator superfamily MFS_1 n=1 Tax=Bermanella marisrubri TaxID=207949 RepID=Q1N1J8_9GAMM|nr:MFS transporter [Bermanella marisrubri]EAT12052.1 Major facilitator superfamily MFS_1 [Oceanobacter sp. RED65] [Bermanella marisrubri]QIZ83523.1 MFS transporter [Bermanella marisrubri]